jgi:two-component system sensor histidine kinase KdpD
VSDVNAARQPGGVTTPEEFGVAPVGRFRIYLGACAGVGKTVAMLEEGWRRHERGTDVVVAWVDTHGRPYTAERLRGLEVLPRRRVDYRGACFEEMDLEAVLARRPAVALVDELAHTNVPGSGPHAKRYEDVLTLLDAGIAVITTVNIQHLESMAGLVEQITKVRVAERVPDWVVRRANQIELVDSSPEALRRRILHGNVYPPERIPEALNHFFKTENLIALRELALRWLADETEEEMQAVLARHGIGPVYDTAERFLVGVTAVPGSDQVLRRAARMAARSKAHLHAVWVEPRDDNPPAAPEVRDRLARLAHDLGATFEVVSADNPVDGLVDFARTHHVTQVVIGSSSSATRVPRLRRSIVTRLIQRVGAYGIDVHVIARRDGPSTTAPAPED